MTPAAPTSRRRLLAGLGLAGAVSLVGCAPADTTSTRSLPRPGNGVAVLLSSDEQSPGTTPVDQLFSTELTRIDLPTQPLVSSSVDEQLAQLEQLGRVGLLFIQAWPDPRIGDRVARMRKDGTVVISVLNRPTDPDQVTLVVGWNDFNAGEQQFAALLAALKVAHPGRGYNIEHVGSDPRNRSDYFRFRGTALAWKPHRADGTIAIKTGQISWSQVSTRGDDQQVLAKRLRTSLQATFPRWTLDGVITGSPAEADTVRDVVTAAGKPAPLQVTDGVTDEVARQIATGDLVGAVYRDPAVLVAAAVAAAVELRAGRPLPVDPQASWRNGYDNLLLDTAAIVVSPPLLTAANASTVLASNPTLLAAVQPS